MNFNIDNKYFKLYTYNKLETIKNEGDLCDSIGIIIKGSINISNYLANDSEFIISHLDENDMFGENLMFSKNPYYPGYIYACTNTKIMYIKKNDFTNLLSTNNDFKIYYLEYISNKFIELQKRIKILSQPNIKEMFLYYIKINAKNEYCHIKSITEVANYLNVPRPSLSRTISQLLNNNIIEIINKDYKIIK